MIIISDIYFQALSKKADWNCGNQSPWIMLGFYVNKSIKHMINLNIKFKKRCSSHKHRYIYKIMESIETKGGEDSNLPYEFEFYDANYGIEKIMKMFPELEMDDVSSDSCDSY
jgi:hypothetical protein